MDGVGFFWSRPSPPCTCDLHRLYLRSLLMPEVVNQVIAMEDKAKGRSAKQKTWAVSPDLFPCQLSPDTLSQAKEVGSHLFVKATQH